MKLLDGEIIKQFECKLVRERKDEFVRQKLLQIAKDSPVEKECVATRGSFFGDSSLKFLKIQKMRSDSDRLFNRPSES